MIGPRPPRPSIGGIPSGGIPSGGAASGRKGRPPKLKLHAPAKTLPGPAPPSGEAPKKSGKSRLRERLVRQQGRAPGRAPGRGVRSQLSASASSAVQAAKQMAKQAAKRIAKQAVKQAVNACLTAGPICWVPVLCVVLVLLAAAGTAAAVVVTFVGSEISQLGVANSADNRRAVLTATGLELPDHVEPQNWQLPSQMLNTSYGWTAISSDSLQQALAAASARSQELRAATLEAAIAAAGPPPSEGAAADSPPESGAGSESAQEPTVTVPPDMPELWDPGPGHDACAAAASLAPESARWETPELIGEDGSLPSDAEFAEALNTDPGSRWCADVVAAKIAWENAPPIAETDTVGACGEACADLVDADGNPRLVALPPPRLRAWAKRVLPLTVVIQEAPITVWGQMTGDGPALCGHQPMSLPEEIDDLAAELAPDGRLLLRLRMPCQQIPPVVCEWMEVEADIEVEADEVEADDEAPLVVWVLVCEPDPFLWDPPHPVPPEEPRQPLFGPMARVGRDVWTLQERDTDAAAGMLMLVGAALDIGAFELVDQQRTLLAGLLTASQHPFEAAPDVTADDWDDLLVATYGATEEELVDSWMGRTDTQGRELGLCHWLTRLVVGASCTEESLLATTTLRVLWGGAYGGGYAYGTVSVSTPIPGYVPGEGCPDVPPAPWGDLDTGDESRLVAVPGSWRNAANSGQIYVSPCIFELLAALVAESEQSMPGGPLRIVSGYRGVTLQENLYVTRGCSPGAGCRWGPLTARPGYSMHHTGQAVDFNVPTEGERFQWLAARLPQHGLVPLTSGSGEVIEPWHWSTNSR